MSEASPSRVFRILKAPALHFAVAGALLFLLATTSGSGGDPRHASAEAGAREIVIDANRIRGLQRDYSLANQVQPTPAETRALVDNLITEEILFREALARGFEQGDRAIAWRLVQKMRFLGEDQGEDVAVLYRKALDLGLHRGDPVVRRILVENIKLVVSMVVPEPTDEELAAWYDEHRDEYAQAGRVSLRHVFFDRGRRGDEEARRAAETSAIVAEGHGGEIASALGGDPFVMGKTLAGQNRADLAKVFGPAFAEEVVSMSAGRWRGPVESAYGWHLVLIEKRFDPRIPELAEVRSSAAKNFNVSRRNQRVAEFLETLRPSYTVRVDEDAVGETLDD